MKRTNQKGITLIALIVTIIVLIIIAGISIATLTADNGVLRQTNLAKVENIEGTAREQVRLGVSAMRLAIAEAQALDNSYKASANTSAIKNKLLEVIKADTTALERDGWSSADDTANSFKIIYAGDDYKNACNDDNAEIVYTITLGQKSIEITNETNASAKDQNGNDVTLDIGGSTGAGTGSASGSGSGSGSGEGDSGDGSTSYTVSLEVNITEAGTAEFTSEGHSGTKLNLKGEQTLTFTATENTGYIFLGWYVGDTLISEDMEYTTGYTVTGGCVITAKYEVGLAAGLYAEGDVLLASWDELVNTYGMGVTKAYSGSSSDANYYKTDTASPYYVLINNAELADGVKLVIADSITNIGSYAFRDCTSLTSVTIPDGVTSIGKSAFNGCTSLESVEMSDSITSIGHYVFENCTSLTSVEIPAGVTSLRG